MDFPTGFSILALGFSDLAVGVGRVQALRAAQANEVSIFLETQREYGSAEMRLAISTLAAFWRKNKQDVEAAFLELTSAQPEEANKLRGYSRLLSGYFTNVARLYEAKLTSKRLTRLIASHPGLNVFYDAAVPINRTRNPNHNSIRYAALLKKVLPRHGDGTY
ncbi:MAG: hypothetical protein K2X34_13025 [Hyphomonadaceae bacterium]|nr:hypothetical protein [Hyphomonadaceae bacterium]